MSGHPKDICVCDHRRALHKDGTGACVHRHTPRCTEFRLKEAHVVLSRPALVLLHDLVETNEPLSSISQEAAAEIREEGFAKYYTSHGATWLTITENGLAYAKDNAMKEQTHDD
ncbi:hypothetical protein J2J97_32375 (plasmid) [Rhizobium bangladeshense]|uniref:hypothetical protein n=1 Tax=Rhizobium bangladeshense TaxID=1138189 RepID=UPI001A98AD35|nr:hypothetical protein [Rhizobium bangladeshense]QSY98602.1 hypothetical protein J2J97_32375 [Rhizobium bangladeshense]